MLAAVPASSLWLQRRLLHGLALVSLIGAARAADDPGESLRFTKPVVLLGEVHDNAAQHALRLRAFEDWLALGARPALLMEQFDRSRQADIDRVLHRQQSTALELGAEAVIDAGAPDRKGWNWAYYEPFVELALRYRLPIVAANVGRDEARAVISDGLAARGFDADVPAALQAAQTHAVEASHCGLIGAAMAEKMARAQVARDQFMARMVEVHAGRSVLLLAGNGHVRNDIGVPQWLRPATRAKAESVGMLEAGDAPAAAAYDRVVFTAAQVRADPCDSMRAPR